jgi:methyl-accepting chemotaxis protein
LRHCYICSTFGGTMIVGPANLGENEMLSKIRGLSLTAQIVLSVSAVLIAGETLKVANDIAGDWKRIANNGELRGNAALDMLEAVHVQAMLNRGQIEDGDPAVETLNGTMAQFSKSNANIDIWIVMADKVLAFQKEQGNKTLPAHDAIDRETLADKHNNSVIEGQALRLSRPVILGQGTASDERCAGCHTGMMGIEPGETMGVYSASVNLGPDIAAWQTRLTNRILVGLGTLAITIILILTLLRLTTLKPLRKLADITTRLANGDTEVPSRMEKRKDEIGALARALEVFRAAFISNKRLEAEAAAHREASEALRIAAQEKAEADAAERLRVATSGLADGLKRLAAGDLSFRIDETFAPEFEALRKDFNASVQQLGGTMRAIRDAAGSIGQGSSDIAAGVGQLSQRTEQQAHSLDETAAALSQITGNVATSAKRVAEARFVAAKATESAEVSGTVVANAEEAMGRIEDASSKIANIIGVIDEIAFQTNLLALNAGVEAARAGDSGKGFAVVAQEVRALAGRSADAAKEIKQLIDNSSHEVAGGVAHVRDTGSALQQIREFIFSINSLMDAITASSNEQSAGLDAVNRALGSLDEVTQQNVTMVERTDLATSGLAGEASHLSEMVARFRLETQETSTKRGAA